MWDRAGNALKRFWGALSGGKYVAGQDGPVNFENLQPIPVINVMEYGADDGDKTPKLYVPNDSTGRKIVYNSQFEHLDDIETEIKNQEVLAAIVAHGGDPLTAHYPLVSVVAEGTVAAGGGAFPAATLRAAQTGKKIMLERVILSLTSDSAFATGCRIKFRDGAGGATLFTVNVCTQQPTVEVCPFIAGTAGTLLEWVGDIGGWDAVPDGDIVSGTFYLRDIG